ncbi:MAG TPA: alpha-L-fucosidase [Clostridia bacterium]|nr:alpha-L-fucosidase [Clostridia bacterium]
MKRTKEDLVQTAVGIVPSERQLKWQELEFYAFIHFGMNTFTNSELGNGGESPKLFNPSKLNAEQWVKIIKAAGMRGLILTAKHHDGFCLWPSEYTEHSVKNSQWRDGNGDLVMEVSQACKNHGIKFGIYLSPWDKHEPSYGEGEAYNEFYKNQLKELLTNYGELFCVWIDGACGKDEGRKQQYDWQGYFEIIRQLQPEAVISICGPDVRWCGNEVGVCRKSEWSVVPSSLYPFKSNEKEKGNIMMLDLGSRKALGKAKEKELVWYPAEVNVSIRKGWFYHKSEDITLKPLSKLMEIYYNSVGANANMLLNVPPNDDGLIPDRDAETLISMGAQLEFDFNENLAEDSEMTGSGCLDNEHCPQMVLTDSLDDYWHSGNNPDNPWIILDMGDDYDIDKVVLREHIRTGQQIEKFSLYGEIGGKWKNLFKGTVIGGKRICRFKEVRVQRIKLVIEQTRCFATISSFEAY